MTENFFFYSAEVAADVWWFYLQAWNASVVCYALYPLCGIYVQEWVNEFLFYSFSS